MSNERMRAGTRAHDDYDGERDLLVMGETGETLVCAIPWTGKMDAHTILVLGESAHTHTHALTRVLACSANDFDMHAMALFNTRGELFVPGDIVDDPTEVLRMRSLKGMSDADRQALPLVHGSSGWPAAAATSSHEELPLPLPPLRPLSPLTSGTARSFARGRDPLGHVLVDCGTTTLRVPIYDVDAECNCAFVLAYLHAVFDVDTPTLPAANARTPVGLFKTYRLAELLALGAPQ